MSNEYVEVCDVCGGVYGGVWRCVVSVWRCVTSVGEYMEVCGGV